MRSLRIFAALMFLTVYVFGQGTSNGNNFPGSGGGNGTVTSVATTAPLGGGTITTTGTLTCTTCATTTNGGSLSGTAPVNISAAGAISCATCVTSAASLTSNAIVLGGGLQASATNSAFTTDGTKQINIGPADAVNNGVLGLNGKTSGTATFTAPSVAGTTTNAVVSSNVITVPAGGVGNVSIGIGSVNSGFYSAPGVGTNEVQAGADNVGFAANETRMLSTGRFTFCPSTTMNCTIDTGMSRSGVDIIAFGNGAAGDTSARVKAAGYMSIGATFTTDTGCGTPSSLAGGATAGKFVGNAVSCTTVVTMGNSATAPTGWACKANDLTTTADTVNQTATTTTTATFSGTIVSGDTINFLCIGY